MEGVQVRDVKGDEEMLLDGLASFLEATLVEKYGQSVWKRALNAALLGSEELISIVLRGNHEILGALLTGVHWRMHLRTSCEYEHKGMTDDLAAVDEALGMLAAWDSSPHWMFVGLLCVSTSLMIDDSHAVLKRLLPVEGTTTLFHVCRRDDKAHIHALKTALGFKKLLNWSTPAINKAGLTLLGRGASFGFVEPEHVEPLRPVKRFPLFQANGEITTVRWATSEDSVFVSQMVFAAFEGHFVNLGLFRATYPSLNIHECVELIRVALTNEDRVDPGARCAFELENFIVAWMDGAERVGSLVPFGDREFPQGETWQTWEKRLQMAAAKRHGDKVAHYAHEVDVACGRCFDFMKPINAFHTELIGVSVQGRGRGVLGALMEASFALGRDLGYNECSLSCMTENARAVAAYRKLGFNHVVQFAAPEVHPYISLRDGFSFMKRKI